MKTRIAFVGIAAAASVAAAQPVVRTDSSGARALALSDAAGSTQTVKNRPNGMGGPDAPTWAALGPYGGDVQAVAASPTNPSIVLAGLAPSGGGGGSLYRSTDGGATWTIVAQLATTSVYDVEFAPDGTAYVGTIDSVWKSTTGGTSWTALNLGIGLNDQVLDVAIDPTNPNNLWAGVADAIGSQPQNLMKSVNGGMNWTNATPPLAAPQSCASIAINPANPQVMAAAFAGAFGGGQVWITSNGGTTWDNRSAGLPANPMNSVVYDGTRFIIGGGQLFGSQTFGLFASPNLGVTWTPLHNGSWPNLVVNDIALDPANSSIILAGTPNGIFRSVNGGTSWTFGAGGTSSLAVNSVRFGPGSSSNIFLGASAAGIYRSTDGGTAFNPSSTGIGALDVFSVASNPNNTSDMAIAFQGQNNGGVYRSTNGGQTWALQSVPGTRYNTVGYAFDGTLYAISDGPSSIAPEGLYRRNPDGTWTGIGPDQGPLFESELYGLRFSRHNPGLIIASGSDFGVAGFKSTVWRTPDGGAHWTKVYLGPDDSKPVVDVEIAEDGTDQTMVASQINNSGSRMGGVLRSIDGGLAWAPSNTGLPAIIQGSSVSPSPGNPMTFFLSNADTPAGNPAGGGLFKSIDGGASWTATGYAHSTKFVECDQVDPQVLYIVQQATGSGDRVYRSQNGGGAFTLFSDNLLTASGTARWLAYGAGTNPVLLLATTTGAYGIQLGSACYANCDGSTTAPILNVNDFICFTNRFAAGDPYANCDASTNIPVLNVNDYVCFNNKFATGCP